MEAIHVIIADRSQLARMGITGILYQTGFPLSIREITDPEKLKIILHKENGNLIILSKSFLSNCSPEIIRMFQVRNKSLRIILINDTVNNTSLHIECDYAIEYYDVERTIYRKLESSLEDLSKSGGISRINEEISLREKEVLKLVALGMTNKEIAEKLYISSHTVITHRKNITTKLGIKTIAGLTVYAVINKLITAEEII